MKSEFFNLNNKIKQEVLETLNRKLAILKQQKFENNMSRYRHYLFDQWGVVLTSMFDNWFLDLDPDSIKGLKEADLISSLTALHEFVSIDEVIKETKLSESEKVQFYLYYLTQHNSFYLIPRNIKFAQIVAYTICQRNEILDSNNKTDLESVISKYKSDFKKISQVADKIQKYMMNSTCMTKEAFELQLSLWGIPFNRVKEISTYLENKRVVKQQKQQPLNVNSLVKRDDAISIAIVKQDTPSKKDLKERLMKFYDGKNIVGYLNKVALKEIKELLNVIYDSETAKQMYLQIYEKNEVTIQTNLQKHLTEDEFFFLEDVKKDLVTDDMREFRQYIESLKQFLSDVREFGITICEEKDTELLREYVTLLKEEIEQFRHRRLEIESILLGKGNARNLPKNRNEN